MDFGDFGFWILDRYVANLYVRPPTPQILDFGGRFWILGILDFGFWGFRILDFGFWGFWILDFGDFGFWILGILDFGFWGRNPKSKIPQSKIQTFLADFGDFGFWILDRYVANLYVAPNFGDFGFWILGISDFGFWIWGILDFGFGDFGFWILDLGDFGFWGFWILDFGDFGFWGFWILDFGPLCSSKSLCEAPNAPNLGDFGFWGFWGFWILGILDFGFWGFWILDFGVWGFWILDFVTNFGFYIRRRRLCTPTRVGGFWNGRERWNCVLLLTLCMSFWCVEGKPKFDTLFQGKSLDNVRQMLNFEILVATTGLQTPSKCRKHFGSMLSLT